MGLSEILEGSRHKLFNRTQIIYHSTMKTAKCTYQIPINNNENIDQIIKYNLGRGVLGFKLYKQFLRIF